MRTSALEREMTRNRTEDRTLADKETMLARLAKWDDDEEDYRTGSRKKRSLIRLEHDGEDSRKDDTSKENQLRTLVSSIPSDTKGLWEYPIHWEGLDNVRFLF